MLYEDKSSYMKEIDKMYDERMKQIRDYVCGKDVKSGKHKEKSMEQPVEETFFPIIIYYTESEEFALIHTFSNLPLGTSFKIVKTNCTQEMFAEKLIW